MTTVYVALNLVIFFRDYYKEIPAVTTPSPPLKEGTVCAARNHSNTEFWRIRVDKLCPKEMVGRTNVLEYRILR